MPASTSEVDTPLENPAGDDGLLKAAVNLIEEGRRLAASSANAALTMTYWNLGRLIDTEILREERAEYGSRIVSSLSTQLTQRYGRSFQLRNLRRMIQFAQAFSDPQIVSTLSTQLAWSHFVELLPVKSSEARLFYAKQAAEGCLGVRELRGIIERKAYQRREIANAQVAPGSELPIDAFKDPYLLDFLGLQDGFSERDLESAIIHDLQAFLLEVGHRWAFVARQKRMILDGNDLYLDLLFFARPLRRLIAVELKLGRFKAAYVGPMKLYLKWLDRYERQDGEEAPIGLVLCTDAGREQIELLEMHKDGIAVAEYWTDLPPKQELESRLRLALRQAKERLARREVTATPQD